MMQKTGSMGVKMRSALKDIDFYFRKIIYVEACIAFSGRVGSLNGGSFRVEVNVIGEQRGVRPRWKSWLL